MSSGNLIQHSYLQEAIYGELNPAGSFQAISKTSAAFTGTPDVTQSATIRSDRLPSGNIVTGLTVTGNVANELARTKIHDDFLAATIMDDWDATPAPVATDIAYNSTTGVMTTVAGDFTAIFATGQAFTLTGLISPADIYNLTTVFVVASITDANNMVVVTGSDVADWDATAGAGATIQQGASATIGKIKKSFSFEKQYLDLTDKAILYLGELFSSFNGEFNYGAPVTMTYDLLGAGKQLPATPVVAPSGARTLLPVPAEVYMNPSTNMPMLMIDGEIATYCVEGITLSLNNGLSAKNCIGQLNKAGYDLGQASIEVGVNAHFSDSNYPFLQRILDQDTVTIAWPVIDANGFGYYFEVSCQLSADDPDVSGQDAQALLELSGSGAIGIDGTTLTVSKLGGDLP
jgi:hypothetical protein